MHFSFDICKIGISFAEAEGEHSSCALVNTKIRLLDFSQILGCQTITQKSRKPSTIKTLHIRPINSIYTTLSSAPATMPSPSAGKRGREADTCPRTIMTLISTGFIR